MKSWTTNLGGRVPIDLLTGVPDYSEYLGFGATARDSLLPTAGRRVWPTHFPVATLQIYESTAHGTVLDCLEGQCALMHHVMAFEEANGGRPGRPVLTDSQRWKAKFVSYIQASVTQSQIACCQR